MGRTKKKRRGTHTTGETSSEQQQHGFLSLRYGQPSVTEAAKQTQDNRQKMGGGSGGGQA